MDKLENQKEECGFNPYFNGYSTLTEKCERIIKRQKVSILILMDTLL